MIKTRSHYQEIGAKGGKNGKGSWAKKQSATNAANIRWARYRETKKFQVVGKAAAENASHKSDPPRLAASHK